MWYKNRSEFYGFTQDPKTLDYIIVTNDKNSFCSNCFEPFKDSYEKWCKKCNAKQFQQNFPNWTSGNEFINKFIQESQLNAQQGKVLEWIPYDRLLRIQYLDKGGFSTIYQAVWFPGNIIEWSSYEKSWERSCTVVALKSLNESSNLNEEFLNEV